MDMPDDDDDELLCEIDVEFHHAAQPLYLFQYPLRPHYRPYDEISFTHARIREQSSLVEMDFFIDPQSTNYYGARGKQFADVANQDEKAHYFDSDHMDKQTIASSNSSTGW